jgi:hypothetical protein
MYLSMVSSSKPTVLTQVHSALEMLTFRLRVLNQIPMDSHCALAFQKTNQKCYA